MLIDSSVRFGDLLGSQCMGEEMESKGAMNGPGYEPMGDGRKREGDYRGDLWQNLLNYRAHMHLSLSNDL